MSPTYFYEVKIILTLKQNKDTTRSQSYRQIPMVNLDAKINKNILAHLIDYMKNIIYHDKVGFIQEMQGWCDTSRSVSVIHYIARLKAGIT